MYVFSPARYFVVGIRSSPENPSVFSRIVVTLGFCFRNFFALSFFISQRVRLGNFRMAMFPIISWGIFFMVGFRFLGIKGNRRGFVFGIG